MSRHYHDEEESSERQVFAQRERLSLPDWILAATAAVLVFVGLSVFAFPSLSPDVWGDAAVAAGLRPPSSIFPGLWRVLAGVFYMGGVGAGDAALPWLGRLCGALTAGVSFLFFRVLVAQLVRLRLRYAPRRHRVVRLSAFAGALFFACSDPMWRAGQAFSPGGLLMLMVLVSLICFVQFLLSGRILTAIAALFLGGVITAETPYGFVLLGFCWYGYQRAYRRGSLSDDNPLLDTGAGQSARWLISFVWVLGLACGIAANCVSFIRLHGLEAVGKVGGDMPLMYLKGWWHNLIGVANPLGWALALGICLLTFAVALAMLPRASDEERLLPYHVGFLTCITGLLAFAQLAMLSPLWFWTWSDSIKINSAFFLQLLMLACSGTVVCALVVFGVEAACRDYERLQQRHFRRLSQGGRFVLYVIALAFLAAGVLPGRVQTATRAMLAIIDDYAREVVAECGPVHWIFTDGSYDARYELLAAEQKKDLYAISLMGSSSYYDQYLRLRGKLDNEDRTALSVNGATGLRAWMLEKPERMADAAVQQGFELWKRQGKELPPCSGVLARPVGMDEADMLKGVANSKKLAERIVAFYAAGGIAKSASFSFTELFRFAQWRISRLARMRSERADRAQDVATAEADLNISERLDDYNSSLQRILADMEHARETTLRQVTPREGLQLALARADFALAASYARPILKAIPDDPEANFGLAMSYVKQQQWARAAEHLKVFAEKRPQEPSAWNNLAMICLKMNRFAEAERHAKKALELIPESAEVKDTIKQIAEAKAAAEGAEPKAKKGDK